MVTIYVVCIVCLLDACPPSSMLDHNTCASNPEQANSQVKIPFVIDPQEYFQIYYATILDVFCSTVTSLSLDFIIFTFSFSSFISLPIFTLRFITTLSVQRASGTVAASATCPLAKWTVGHDSHNIILFTHH